MDNESFSQEEKSMISSINKMGVDATQYSKNDIQYLIRVAKQCAKTSGLAVGAAGALYGASAGSVSVPGIGAVPGYVVGFLSGWAGGTFVCTVGRGSMKKGLDILLGDYN